MKLSDKMGPLIKAAVKGRIETYKAIHEITDLFSVPEWRSQEIENTIVEFVDDWALDSETAEGFGAEDARVILEKFGIEDAEIEAVPDPGELRDEKADHEYHDLKDNGRI